MCLVWAKANEHQHMFVFKANKCTSDCSVFCWVICMKENKLKNLAKVDSLPKATYVCGSTLFTNPTNAITKLGGTGVIYHKSVKSQKLAWTVLKPGGQQTNTLSCICSLQWNPTGEGIVASSNRTVFCQRIEQCGFDPLVSALQHGNQKAKSWLTLKIQKSSFSNIIVVFQTKQVLNMKWTRNKIFHFRKGLTCMLPQHSMRQNAHEEI